MDSLYSRYAQALFSIALEENKIESYRNEIKMLSDLFKQNPEYLHLLSSYFLSFEEKEASIDTIYPNNPNIANFIKVIVRNNRSYHLMKILDEFIKECNEYSGIKEGTIYSVKALDAKEIKKIEDALSIKLKAKVELKNSIDERLIGGVKIVVEDKIFDGSVKNKLERLRESLIKGGE